MPYRASAAPQSNTETFFLQHNALQDRESDELGGRSDGLRLILAVRSSAAPASDDERAAADQRARSKADPIGPWRQTPVGAETWGKSARPSGAGTRRDFASTHTGPKGVIADFEAETRSLREERQRQEEERTAVLHRIATRAVPPLPRRPALESSPRSQGDSDDSDLEDDAVLAQYAARRVQEMHEDAAARRRRTTYGGLEYISPERFVTLTADTMSFTGWKSMLVHLYHSDSYACSLLNTHLELLAQKLVHVKFAALVAEEADASIDMADLPVLLVFRDQKQQEAVVDVTRRLGGAFTFERVEALVNELLGL